MLGDNAIGPGCAQRMGQQAQKRLRVVLFARTPKRKQEEQLALEFIDG